MNLNLNIVVPIILLAVCLVAWLVYRNFRDERKFEHDIDVEEERLRKERKKPL